MTHPLPFTIAKVSEDASTLLAVPFLSTMGMACVPRPLCPMTSIRPMSLAGDSHRDGSGPFFRPEEEVALWRAAADRTEEAILFVDRASMTILEANRAARRMLGCEAEELGGAGLDRVVQYTSIAEVTAAFDAAIGGQPECRVSPVRLRGCDGKDSPHQWVIFAVATDCGPVLVVVARPISETWVHPGAGGPGQATDSVLSEGSAAGFDALTGLPDRCQFAQRLASALAGAADDPPRRVAVLFIDLDGFKAANDTLGHLAGDRLLREIAGRMAQCVRGGDLVARYGGDEFVVLLDGLQGPEGALRVAERIQARLRAPPVAAAWNVPITASIGIALSGPKCRSPDQMLQDADRAMYRAKAAGKAGCAVFQEEEPPVS